MINKIKEKINLNEKVYIELVDPNGLRDRGDTQEYLIQDLLDNEKLRVLGVGLGTHGNLVKVRLDISCRIVLIDEENLVFFEIVSGGETFDDLIDAVVQAKKDGVVSRIMWDSNGVLEAYSPHDIMPIVAAKEGVSSDFIADAINTIESYYTETFVIEYDSDIEDILDGAKIKLTNGRTGTFNSVSGLRSITDDESGFEVMGLNMFWLKGATVSQRRKDEGRA